MTTTLHERIRAVIGDRTIREVAELTATHRETVRRYVQGQSPSVDFLCRLCGSLGVCADWLLCGVGPVHRRDVRVASLREAGLEELMHVAAERIGAIESRVREHVLDRPQEPTRGTGARAAGGAAGSQDQRRGSAIGGKSLTEVKQQTDGAPGAARNRTPGAPRAVGGANPQPERRLKARPLPATGSRMPDAA